MRTQYVLRNCLLSYHPLSHSAWISSDALDRATFRERRFLISAPLVSSNVARLQWRANLRQGQVELGDASPVDHAAVFD